MCAIIYFVHIYHVCDVLFLLLYTMCGWPFMVVSLRALYSASGRYQPPGFSTPRWSRYYHAYMYARV